jgi:RNA polymerase sigma-70 factor (ECF subfamily)
MRIMIIEVGMALTVEDERSLVSQAQRGSAQALATLLQASYAAVYRTLLKLTLDTRAAEDATQDAMERAVRSFSAYDPEKARFTTWLVAIARNRWLDGIRRDRRLRPLDETTPSAPESAIDPTAALIESDALLSALRRLGPKARAPVAMSYLLGYTHEDIALAMKIPLGTVKSRIFNGLRQLRKEMGPDGQ